MQTVFNRDQDRQTFGRKAAGGNLVGVNGQQLMQIVHATIGVVFISGIILHIYTGTVGIEGSYSAMGSGEVDLAWARQHHDLWVEEQQAKTASGPQLKGHPQPAE